MYTHFWAAFALYTAAVKVKASQQQVLCFIQALIHQSVYKSLSYTVDSAYNINGYKNQPVIVATQIMPPNRQ